MAKRDKYTFKQWCLDNDRQDLLDRWDYEKTGFKPEDITYSSNKDVFFKCPEGIHESAKRKVFRVTGKNTDQRDFKCLECLNGHAQNFEDLTGKVFGELIVLELDNKRNHSKTNDNNQTYWLCKCSCGSTISTYGAALKRGDQKTCGNRTIHKSGENASNWKGGITSELILQRNNILYDSWRNSVYKKDWFTCQCCGKSKNIEKNAHHLKNFSEYKELQYDISNGILLCSECHHIKCIGSFHNIYGTHNNDESQLEEYINNKRKQLGINIPFSIDEYKNGKILKPDDIKNNALETWIFDIYAPSELRTKNGFIKIQSTNNVKEEYYNGRYEEAS